MKFSLRAKTVMLIVAIALVLGLAGTMISGEMFRDIIDTTYKNRSLDVSRTVAAVVDAELAESLLDAVMAIYNATDEKVGSDEWETEAFETYIAHFAEIEQREDFQELQKELRTIQDVNDVDCLYLCTMDTERKTMIYLVDGAYEDVCPPGCFDPQYEENVELPNPERGFLPFITNTEAYGWLVTAGVPVHSADGRLVCYAMTDISMDEVRGQQNRYALLHSAVLLGLTLLVSVVGIWAVNRAIIRPINMLSSAAAHYNAGQDGNSALENLPIRSKDEIQSLYASIQTMVHNIRGYIDNLMITNQELTQTRIEANEMNELAHKDALTGVGSKLAYDQQVTRLTEEMRQGKAEYGIVMVDMNGLKEMNDTYGHEKGNIAIRNTCAVICEVFHHSPVYRFGGDEFVVVIKDRDYAQIEDRVREFREAAARTQGEPWEKVNAAIGYALFEGDDTVDDVFRRADHIMYENKKEMKAKAEQA